VRPDETLTSLENAFISAMFCSHECMTVGHRFHQFECNIDMDMEQDSCIFRKNHRVVFEALGVFGKIRKLKTFLEQHAEHKTIFDLDLSETNSPETIERNLVQAVHSLQRNAVPKNLEPLMEEHCKLMASITKNQDHKKFLEGFMRHQMELIITNSFGLMESVEEIGSGIFPFASYFNHSCAPNVGRITVDGCLVFFILRPVEKNQQLFVCYRSNFFYTARQERQDEILESYRFVCTCEACQKNYPRIEKLPKHDRSFSLKNSSSLPAIMKEYKDNCAYISANYKSYPSFEICKLIERNVELLHILVCTTTFCIKPKESYAKRKSNEQTIECV
jgi:hypothetical protein